MSGIKELNTQTTTDSTDLTGTTKDIVVSYIGDNVDAQDLLPNTINAIIQDFPTNNNVVNGLENDLILDIKKSPLEFQCFINANGDLNIVTTTKDVNNYTINSNGDLIYIFNN